MEEWGVETEEWNSVPNPTVSGTPTTPVFSVIKLIELYYLSHLKFRFLLNILSNTLLLACLLSLLNEVIT